MKFLAVASTLLLAGSAVAAPGTARRAERHRKRVEGIHKGNPMNRIANPVITNITNTEYSENWAGAILIGTGYKSVTAEFVVPTPSTTGSGSAWVGPRMVGDVGAGVGRKSAASSAAVEPNGRRRCALPRYGAAKA